MQDTTSPYSNAYGLEYENGDIILQRVPFDYTPSEFDVIHTVKDGENIQSISYQYYGDSGRWGDIADANAIYNPIVELVPELQLIIPDGRQ